jgi:NurA-like 5'-3' nuclease
MYEINGPRPCKTAREHALTTRQELKDIINALEKHSKTCRK